MISSIALASAGAAAVLGLVACQVDERAGEVQRCALGVHVEAPRQAAIDQLVALEAEVGHSFTLDRQYHELDGDAPGDYERWTADQGRIPLFSITGNVAGGSIPWAQIADPSDARAAQLLTALAGRVRDFGRPVYLIFHDEAQRDSSFGTAAEFVAAWRRIVEVFRAAGAGNARWVWSLSSTAFPAEADAWYPGDAWVDWIAATGFNWYTADPVSPWRTFSGVFASFHEWAHGRGKPLLITSTSSAENPSAPGDQPRSKATWIREVEASLEQWPEIQGLIWYHGPGPDDVRDWRLDSSPAALAAFRELAAAPHFDVSGQTQR